MFAALVALAMAAPAAPADKEKELSEAAQKELKKFEGKWTAEKVTVGDNEETPPADAGSLEFKGRKLILGDKEIMTVAALDPSTNPKLLDLKAAVDLGELTKDTIYEAIYKFDGDTLTIALYTGAGNKRPDKFESPKDSQIVLVTLKREKK